VTWSRSNIFVDQALAHRLDCRPRGAVSESAGTVNVQIREGHEAPNVLVSVTEGFAGKLHPRVREEFSVLPSDSHANQSASDPVRDEHSGKGQRPHEALGAEYAEPRGTHQREGETASLWET